MKLVEIVRNHCDRKNLNERINSSVPNFISSLLQIFLNDEGLPRYSGRIAKQFFSHCRVTKIRIKSTESGRTTNTSFKALLRHKEKLQKLCLKIVLRAEFLHLECDGAFFLFYFVIKPF